MQNQTAWNFVQRHEDKILHYTLSPTGQKLNEKAYSITEFHKVWWWYSKAVLNILENQDRLEV